MLGINNTIFFFGNLPSLVVPLLQLCVISVTLIESNSIIEFRNTQELAARPIWNLTVLLGCVASASTMILAIAFANASIIFLTTAIASLLGLNFGNVPSIIPTLNLIFIDLPTTLLFWSSLALFVRIVVKHATIAFVLATIAATLAFLLIFVVPFYSVGAVTGYNYDFMVVSDLVPRFPDATILLNRAGLIVAAGALIVFSALIWNRLDVKRRSYAWFGFASVLVLASLTYAQTSIIASVEKDQKNWSNAHRSFDVKETVDLLKLSGNVTINPGRSLELDLTLVVSVPDDFSATELIFSFNPSMTIDQLIMNGSERDFEFQQGLLSMPYSCGSCVEVHELVISIRARGRPDELFGYLEPEIDYLGSTELPHHVRKLFGTQNSIFNKRFVALMPASRWYPVPGSLKVDQYVEALQRAPDLFDLELVVTVASDGWNVAGPGYKTRHSIDSRTFTFRTGHEIPHFAIIASRFVSRSTTVEEFDLEALIHARHSDIFDGLELLKDPFEEYLAQRLRRLASVDIKFRNQSVTFVEVPNYLRTVGGFGMKFVQSLPGVILIKESAIPLSNFDDITEKRSKNLRPGEELDERLFSHFQEYSERNLVGGNIAQAFAEQLYPYAYQQFKADNVALNYLRRLLIADSIVHAEYSYVHTDAEIIASFVPLMTAHPVLTLDFLLKRFETHYPLSLAQSMIEYVFVGSDSLAAESVVLSELETLEDSIRSFKVLYLKVWTIYRAFREMYGGDALHKIIAPLRPSIDLIDGMGSVEYLYRNASSVDLKLGSFVREWLTTDAIPGFQASEVEAKMVDAKDALWTHHATLEIRNDQDAHGVVDVYLSGQLEDFDAGTSVEVPPNTSYRFNLYSKEPVLDVSIQTFHSMNGGFISRRIPQPDEDDVARRIRPFVEASQWVPQGDDSIVIDNLDEGIELIGNSQERPTFVEKISSWMNVFPVLPKIQRNGVEYGMTHAVSSSADWKHVDLWTAYGQYRQTSWETFSKSARTVRFTTDLPQGGKWNLQYHFPYLYPYWRQYGRYHFILRNGAQEHPITMDANSLSGWVDLGSFDIVGSTVQLDLISVEPSDSRRVADAIRWRRVND